MNKDTKEFLIEAIEELNGETYPKYQEKKIEDKIDILTWAVINLLKAVLKEE